MANDEQPIAAPRSYPGRTLTRKTAEGLVGLIPGVSLLTNVYAVTHPPIEEVERQRWEVDVTRRTNQQDEVLKSVVAAFLRMKLNHQQASNAQQLSFLRGGMVSTLEVIWREGLTPHLQDELRHKLESTSSDVEELLEGLDAARMSMSDDPNSREFVDTLHDVVFGSFGKSGIRREIERLITSDGETVESQKRRARSICESIDRFNLGLQKLSNHAVASVTL